MKNSEGLLHARFCRQRCLKEGTQDYALVAPQEQGEYLIECTVKCGRGHDDMNMRLVVKN